MRKLSLTCCTFALLFSTALHAQPRPSNEEVKFFDRYSVAVPPAWKVLRPTSNSIQIYVPLLKPRPVELRAPEGTKNLKPESTPVIAEALMTVTIEPRDDHRDALQRVASIASEQPVKPVLLIIHGLPAIERRYQAPMPQPGQPAENESREQLVWWYSAAVAADNAVIRFHTMLAPDADPKWLDDAAAIAHSLRAAASDDRAQRDLDEIAHLIQLPPAAPHPSTNPPHHEHGGRGDERGGSTRVQGGFGELEVAASADGQHVVVAANSGWSTSDNSGATFTTSGATPCIYGPGRCDGDPSISIGASGFFYYSWIGYPPADGTHPGAGTSDSLSRSATTDAHAWTFRSDAVFCQSGTPCPFPDQEHIAADRFSLAAGSNDRIYLVWRALGSGIRIVCSSDSGATWSAQSTIDAAGDYVRVNVGPDGSVYAAYQAGTNLNVRKYSRCDAPGGFTPQPAHTVSAFTNVVCPVPGLDRCSANANILASPTVAPDDTDANHVYYAFSTSTAAGNEDVLVFDSPDGGTTWPRSIRVNSAVPARRFMPWVASFNGVALLTWYDRRNGTTAATIDRTRFFGGRVSVKSGSLVASEYDVSQIDDPQCATNFPCGSRSLADASTCPAPAPTTFLGSGCPKYGDYNGTAAMAGRRFSAWASATPPPGVMGASAGINVFASGDNVPSDYYVRDWTSSDTMFDTGVEPSTNPFFWNTSDVWNQSTMSPLMPASGWIAGDAPSRGGTNIAFARVSRRYPAHALTPDEDVQVHLLAADYGAGLPFADIGTTTATFHAADNRVITPGVPWTVQMTASIHLCLAAEITGPLGTDNFIAPSLAMHFAGPSDPLILADNNKAQRNLADTVTAGGASEFISQIGTDHDTESLILNFYAPQSLSDGDVEIIGAGKRANLKDGRIDAGRLRAGETRFVRLRLQHVTSEPTVVDFSLGDEKRPYNGFTIRARKAPVGDVAASNMREWRSVMLRLAEIRSREDAKREADAAARFNSDALAYLRAHWGKISVLAGSVATKEDPTSIHEALAALRSAIGKKNEVDALTAQKSLIERLDAKMTMDLHARGEYFGRSKM